MPRGGRRRGRVGGQYPNRTDLRNPGAPDIPKATAFKGQQYGAETSQGQVQASTAGVTDQAVLPPAPTGPAPGSFGDFSRPTERPNEPLTAGLSTGPGPGPEALGDTGNPEDADFRQMAIYLPTLELLANLPSASMATKNFVRRLRGAAPSAQNPVQGL